jgi:Domain of unknown function (DUF4260)
LNAVTTKIPESQRRLAYAGLAAGLVAAIVFVYAREDVGWWPVVAFGLGPDVALLLGAGRGLERGQLHPRAVPLYNAVHRFWGPLALGIAALAASLPAAWLVGALAWATHVAVDRAVGYGLRTRDGFQRG